MHSTHKMPCHASKKLCPQLRESARLLTVHRVHWSNDEQTTIDLQQLLIYMRRRLVCYSNSQSIVRVYKQLTKPVSDNSPEIGYCAVAYRYECFILSKINCCIKYSRKQNWRQRWHRFSGTPILSRIDTVCGYQSKQPPTKWPQKS